MKKKKTLTYKLYGETFRLNITKGAYTNNGTLYLGLIEEETGEPFADITINLPESYARGNIQYLDSNDMPDIEQFLIKNKLGTNMGSGKSGFCSYPLFWFDMKEVEKYLIEA